MTDKVANAGIDARVLNLLNSNPDITIIKIDDDFLNIASNLYGEFTIVTTEYNPSDGSDFNRCTNYLENCLLDFYGENESISFAFFMPFSEAIVNAQKHSHKTEDNNKIQLLLKMTPTHVIGSVSSTGYRWNQEKAMQCLAKAETLHLDETGRGLYFMKLYCNLVLVNHKNEDTELILGKVKN